MVTLRILSNSTLRVAACRTPARLGGSRATSQTPANLPARMTRRAFSTTPRAAAAAQGYGDPEGNPEAKDPQRQPGATRAQHDAEHPGPPPPDVGRGTGAGPTKGAMHESMNRAASSEQGKAPADASAESGGSRSREARETGSSPTGGRVANADSSSSSNDGPGGGGAGGDKQRMPGGEALKGPQGRGAPQPKIQNQTVPGTRPGLTEEQKREVEQHNREFEKRHDRAAPAGEDLVDKKFWQRT